MYIKSTCRKCRLDF